MREKPCTTSVIAQSDVFLRLFQIWVRGFAFMTKNAGQKEGHDRKTIDDSLRFVEPFELCPCAAATDESEHAHPGEEGARLHAEQLGGAARTRDAASAAFQSGHDGVSLVLLHRCG